MNTRSLCLPSSLKEETELKEMWCGRLPRGPIFLQLITGLVTDREPGPHLRVQDLSLNSALG